MPLHDLICNAGIMAPTEWLPSKQNFVQFATNIGPHFLVNELLCKLQCTSPEVRVVIPPWRSRFYFDLDPKLRE